MTTPAFPVAPRSELREAFVWIALGALIVIGSWRMDRFTQQGAEIYTAPGFWPAIVGGVIAILGGVLAWRAVRRARLTSWTDAQPDDTEYASGRMFSLAIALFFIYAVLLVGRGLPFWLGTALFVATYVFVFRRAARLAGERTGSTPRDALFAIVCGVATAAVVTFVFQTIFYVRLP